MDRLSSLTLTDQQRAIDRAWCRDFIEHNCIFRSPHGKRLLVAPGIVQMWQFYMQVAVLNPEFMKRLSRLFWDRFHQKQPFQLCGCETGGVGVAMALQRYAFINGLRVNVFTSRKKPKAYGLKNRYEGIQLKDTPVLLVDDIAGTKETLKRNAAYLLGNGMRLCSSAFAIVACKDKKPDGLQINGAIDLSVFYALGDFAMTELDYIGRYRRKPEFGGSLK